MFGSVSTEEAASMMLQDIEEVRTKNREIISNLDDFSINFLHEVIDFESIPAGEKPEGDALYNELLAIINMGGQYVDFRLAFEANTGKYLVQLVSGRKTKGHFDRCPLGEGLKSFNDGEKVIPYNGLGLTWENLERDCGYEKPVACGYWVYDPNESRQPKVRTRR